MAASDAGLPSAASLVMALLVCAGASQLVALRLVAEGGAVWLILLSTLVVNLRFVMYSASLASHFEPLPARWKGLLAYLVNDASYALAVRFPGSRGTTVKRNRTRIGTMTGTGAQTARAATFSAPGPLCWSCGC